MSKLLTDLYRYRSREKKENREDYLTECVAAIIRHLPASIGAQTLADFTGQDKNAIEAVWPLLTIETQRPIERDNQRWQKPDLLIWIGDAPWLLFENKVAHSIDEGFDKYGNQESQLHRYGWWLKDRPLAVPSLTQGLIFLTHFTEVPRGFLIPSTDHPAYKGLLRRSGTWGQFGRILDRASAHLPPELHARALILAYRAFLKEYRMDSDYPEQRDFAALAGYVEQHERWSKLLHDMFGRFATVAPFSGNYYKLQVDAAEGSFYTSRYLRSAKCWDESTYIAVGIWFPDRGEGWSPDNEEIGPDAKVFVELANSENGLGLLEGQPNGDWLREDEISTWEEISAFPGDGLLRTTAILTWLDQRAEELKGYLASHI